MWFESKLKANARNVQSGATGLIQFMPMGSIKELDTTPEALAAMSGVEQLDFVERYFSERGYSGRMKTLADVYMAVFWPAAIGKPDNTPLITDPASKAYIQNRGLDLDKDGQITKAEAAGYVERALVEGLSTLNATHEEPVPTQVAAPIEDQSTTHMEAPMPSILDALGPIATAINPIAGILLSAFTPFLKEKLTKEIDRHTDTPGIGEQVSDVLIGAAMKATGKADPLEAVAVARQDPAIMAKIEASATEWLAQMSPLLDKMAAMEQARWTANDVSADKAAVRGQKDKVDLAPVLVRQSGYAFGAAAVAVMGLLALQMYVTTDGPDPTLTGFLGILIYGVVRMMDRPSAYRFGGAFDSDSAAATRAVVNETIRQQPKGKDK